MPLIFKICSADEWDLAEASGNFAGSEVDRADGFVHFSTAAQVAETAARHFTRREGLVLAAFDDGAFGTDLRYEPSRGGALFPHLYGALDPVLAHWIRPLSLGPDGRHILPDLDA